jgi:hypothetical protein
LNNQDFFHYEKNNEIKIEEIYKQMQRKSNIKDVCALLDMKSSVIAQAFIQGRNVSLDNKGKQLYERYKHKYQLK